MAISEYGRSENEMNNILYIKRSPVKKQLALVPVAVKVNTQTSMRAKIIASLKAPMCSIIDHSFKGE